MYLHTGSSTPGCYQLVLYTVIGFALIQRSLYTGIPNFDIMKKHCVGTCMCHSIANSIFYNIVKGSLFANSVTYYSFFFREGLKP